MRTHAYAFFAKVQNGQAVGYVPPKLQTGRPPKYQIVYSAKGATSPAVASPKGKEVDGAASPLSMSKGHELKGMIRRERTGSDSDASNYTTPPSSRGRSPVGHMKDGDAVTGGGVSSWVEVGTAPMCWFWV